jgi:glycosyltransferase involved in cell wall biosynthesis
MEKIVRKSKQNSPMCSVIITCYNYGQFIDQCIQSVVSQTYRDFEIIVINDGSTDNTDEIIQPYLCDDRIRYVKQTNAGQANAKNTGIKKSNGQFIAFLDADDVWEKSKLEKQIKLFQNAKIGVVFSRAKYINEKGEHLNYKSTLKYLEPKSGNVTTHLFYDNFVPFSSSVVRHECFDKYGCFDETLEMAIDWDLWLRLSVGYQFEFINEPLLFYRIGHAGQMSRDINKRYLCLDRIINNFTMRNHNLLPDSMVRDAMSYKYCGRGYYYRSFDPLKSLKYYLLAIKNNPLKKDAYIGFLKSVLINSLLRHKK